MGHLRRKGDGKKIPINYELTISQRKTPDAPSGKVEYKASGKITPLKDPKFILDNIGGEFMLHLEDGRKIEIFIAHGNGAISGTIGDNFY